MSSIIAGALWLGFIAWLLQRVVRQFRAYRLDALEVGGCRAPLPSLAVVVPVRNEILNIGGCLRSLSAQTGLADRYAVIVVDDESEDGTAAAVKRLAAADRRIRLISADLPEGWLGKPHACWRGAMSVESEWLCFLDADVRAEPELLSSAVQLAEAQGIDMLSLQTFQELGSLWERLIIPAGLLMIACAKDFRSINDPTSAAATVNGQFILIRRSVYLAVGGHAAVRAAVCEDKALAARVKQAGFRLRMLSGERLVRTRMYTDLESLWEGFSKNAVEIMGSGAGTLAVAALGAIVGWTALLLPLALGVDALATTSRLSLLAFALSFLGSAIVLGVQIGTIRHFRLPAFIALLLPLGYTMAAALAWRSVVLRRSGRVTWKGRKYEVPKSISPGCV
ncbi:MAG TPA: glycosyltransferase family 2 protein [Alphaproteobacteria bacterium]|nr:glycosyltransferase family 2 protein [Alphaproteobacteria bacterium]